AHRALATERFMFGAGIVFGGANLAASLAPTLAVFVVVLSTVGACQMLFLVTANTLIQLRADARMRGRVMSVYAMARLGSTPIGGPLIGWISQEYGPRYGIALGGAATVVGTLVLGGRLVRERQHAGLAERERQSDFAPADPNTAIAT